MEYFYQSPLEEGFEETL